MDATFALYGQAINPVTHQSVSPFLCTAFAFKADSTGYLLLSAGHCVDDEPSESTFAVSEQIGGPLQRVSVVSARFEPSVGAYEDYAVFHLATSKKYPVLDLGDDIEGIDSKTINPNFAFGITKQYAHGIVASDVMVNSIQCSTCDHQIFIHEFSGIGASGSAVIAEDTHKVIGLLVSQIDGGGFTVESIANVKQSMLKPDEFEQLHQMHENFLQKMLEEMQQNDK
jgi:hypothetical protein